MGDSVHKQEGLEIHMVNAGLFFSSHSPLLPFLLCFSPVDEICLLTLD